NCVGLPTFVTLRSGEDASSATADQLAVATAAIDQWRTWRDLPRESALQARVHMLAAALSKPSAALRDTEESWLTAARQWTGHAAEQADAFVAWWQQARLQPYEQLLRDALQLPHEQAVSMLEALDQSANAPIETAKLWRQL